MEGIGRLISCCGIVSEWNYKIEESWVLTKASCGHGRSLLKVEKF